MGHDTEQQIATTVATEEHFPGYQASNAKKCLVVFITSLVTLTACFSSTSLFSAATVVAIDLNTTTETINACSAGLLFTMGLSNFVWGPLIPLVGRLHAWHACIVALLLWTIATSLAPNLTTFVIFRVLSGFQGTFFHVTGQAILAEYFPPTSRGTATGFFLCGTVLGPPLGPLVAGIVVTYASWRVILYIQAGMILLGLILSIAFLHDSDKPTIVESPTIMDIVKRLNPARVLILFRYPDILLPDLACGLLAWSQYALLSSPHHILITQYNLTSPLVSGLFYLSPAAGFLVGTLVGGRISDHTVRKWIQKRGGVRLPQDRLRSGFLSWFLVIPAASLAFGWGVDKQIGGLALPIVTAFFNAAGILSAFAGLNTYCSGGWLIPPARLGILTWTTEVMPSRRQEAIATKYLVQYTTSAVACGTTIPLLDSVGSGLQSTISVIFVYLAGALCIVTVLFGAEMHKWAETGPGVPEKT